MSTPPNKRRRVEVPPSVKRQICQYKTENPKATIQDIRSFIMKDNNLELGKSTIGDILKAKDKWLTDDIQRTSRPAMHQKLDDALFMWFTDMTSHHAAVNDEMMLTKAKTLGQQLNITDFSNSRGWLHRFKGRRGIKRRLYEGEADSADMTAVDTGRKQLQQLLKDYSPDDIYNLDETGLFYRLGPNATLATQKVQGTKKSKERLTVALAANASGTDKRRPFVIAKVQRPRCFGKTYNPDTYVLYRWNKKAWMTANLFIDWLSDFDRQMRLQGRSVILLVDNAASHTQGDLRLRNVKLHFLPPNTTSHIQPMDAGIIKTFKTYYRKQLIQHYIDCAEADEPQTVNVRQALKMIKNGWDAVNPTTISNCFRHVRILTPEPETQPAPEQDNPEDNLPLVELRRLMRQLQTEEDFSAEDYVAVDEGEVTGQQLEDDDILSLVCGDRSDTTETSHDDAEDPDDQICPDTTLKQATYGLDTVISYFEQLPAHFSDKDAEDNKRCLETLLTMKSLLRDRTIKECRQTKMTDFFKC